MISGLVIHLANDEKLRNEAMAAMRKRVGLEVGDQIGHRLPLVIESAKSVSVEDTTDWLKNLPGVVHADITFVYLEE